MTSDPTPQAADAQRLERETSSLVEEFARLTTDLAEGITAANGTAEGEPGERVESVLSAMEALADRLGAAALEADALVASRMRPLGGEIHG